MTRIEKMGQQHSHFHLFTKDRMTLYYIKIHKTTHTNTHTNTHTQIHTHTQTHREDG